MSSEAAASVAVGDVVDCVRLGREDGEVLAVCGAWAWVRWSYLPEPLTIKCADLVVTLRAENG